MRSREARKLGGRISELVEAGQIAQAYWLLSPILSERAPFAMLRRIGEPIGAGPLQAVNPFLERVAVDRAEGGWVIIASALKGQLERDLPGAFDRCRGHIVAADVWYGADILGEGVIGEALVAHFQEALEQLEPWRQDANPWVRRAVGVSAHFWAKRSRGLPCKSPHARILLAFLEPMFGERDMRVVKGVGWGLKTLGRYYPEQVTTWLARDVVPGQRCHRVLMLRKALTYLSDEQRARVTGDQASSSR